MRLRWVHANEALPDPADALDEPSGLLCAGMDLKAFAAGENVAPVGRALQQLAAHSRSRPADGRG